MKQISLLTLCFLLSLSTGWAQDKISFNETTHDFGKIDEKNGNASCEFTVTNGTDAPLVINRVTASCGCTTPSWTKEPIAPGKTGTVLASFSPVGRPGPFSKTISVYTNAQQAPSILTIKGEVLQGKRSPEEEYPFTFGSLRLKNNNLGLGNIAVNEVRKAVVEIYNSGTTAISLKFDKLPKYITVSSEPAVIPAGTEAKMIIAINAPAVKRYGKVMDNFQIIVGNDIKGSAKNNFTVGGTIVDDFSKSDKSTSPKMSITTPQIHFGKVSDPGAKTFQVVKISNSGKTDLILHDIQCDNSTFSLSKNKAVVKPGEIFELKINLAKKITAPVRASMSIISNDPTIPVKDILIVANP